MTRIAALTMLLWLGFAAQARAQTCTDLDLDADSSDGASGVWSGLQQVAKSGLTVSTELKVGSGLVDEEFYITTGPGVATTPAIAGVRATSIGTWAALDYNDDVTPAEIWVDTGENAATGTCAAISFQIDTASRCYKVTINGTTYGPYGQCSNTYEETGAAGQVPIRVSYYGAVADVSATPFEVHNTTWTLGVNPPNCSGQSCVSEIQCEEQSLAFTPCASIGYTFCDGQSETFSALDPAWWDQLFGVPTAKAVLYGTVPPDPYATARTSLSVNGQEVSSGVVVGPNTVVASSHELDEAIDGKWQVEDQDFRVQLDAEGLATEYQVRRVDFPGRGDPSPGPRFDMALLYTRDTLPPPYVSEIYDHTDPVERSRCTDIIAQGFHLGATTNLECNYAVLYDFSPASDFETWMGWCVDPWTARQVGGDSGGPLYAIGDWDGPGGADPYAKLVGPQGGGHVWNRYNKIRPDQTTWYAANLSAPAEPLTTVGGVDFDDVEWDWDDGQDIDATPVTVTCKVTASSSTETIVAAGCEAARSAGASIEASCSSNDPTGNVYECPIVLPQGSGDTWQLRNVFVALDTGEVIRVDRSTLSANGLQRTIVRAGTTTTPDDPEVTLYAMPKNVAPGGEGYCSLNAGIPSGDVFTAGCVGGTAAGGHYVGQGFETIQPNVMAGPFTLDPGTTPGALLGTSAYAVSSKTYRSGIANNPATTPAFDCSMDTPDMSHSTPGVMVSVPTTNVSGRNTEYEVYLRASVTNVSASYLIGEGTINSQADAIMGVQFAGDGTFKTLDNGAWSADSVINYSADTWYRVRFEAIDLTRPTGVGTPRYTVKIATCGSGFAVLSADATPKDGTRIYTGPQEYTLETNAGQTIDLVHNDWQLRSECDNTQCVWEGWDCGAPNGCGGTLSCGTCTGGDTCGGSGTPYVCGQGGGAICDSYSAPFEITATSQWVESGAQTAATQSLTVETYMRATAGNAVLGISDTGSISEFDDVHMLVRMNDSTGLWDVRDGDGYGCGTGDGNGGDSSCTVPWAANEWYRIVLQADVVTEAYTVSVGPCGGSQTTVITDAFFRKGAGSVDPTGLSYYAAWSNGATVDVENTTWSAVCNPLTCDDIGATCGTGYSDGCGGTIDCNVPSGTCTGGCADCTLPDVCFGQTCCTPSTTVCTDPDPDYECGNWPDGCGGTVNCDTGGQTCDERVPGETCNTSGQCTPGGSSGDPYVYVTPAEEGITVGAGVIGAYPTVAYTGSCDPPQGTTIENRLINCQSMTLESNTTIRNSVLTLTPSAGGGSECIYLNRGNGTESANVTIEYSKIDCQQYDTKGIEMFDEGGGFDDHTNFRFERNVWNGSHDYFFTKGNLDGMLIKDNVFLHFGAAPGGSQQADDHGDGFQIAESPGGDTRGTMTIVGNYFEHGWPFATKTALLFSTGNDTTNNTNIIFNNNRIADWGFSPIWCANSDSCEIKYNVYSQTFRDTVGNRCSSDPSCTVDGARAACCFYPQQALRFNPGRLITLECQRYIGGDIIPESDGNGNMWDGATHVTTNCPAYVNVEQ